MKITEAEVEAIFEKSERKMVADPAYAEAMRLVTDCLLNDKGDDELLTALVDLQVLDICNRKPSHD
jgi:hypothetical protein